MYSSRQHQIALPWLLNHNKKLLFLPSDRIVESRTPVGLTRMAVNAPGKILNTCCKLDLTTVITIGASGHRMKNGP